MLIKDILVHNLTTEQARAICGVLDPALGADKAPLTADLRGLLNQARPRINGYKANFPHVRLHDSVTYGCLGMDAYAFGPQGPALRDAVPH